MIFRWTTCYSLLTSTQGHNQGQQPTGLDNRDHSWILYCDPIDRLHRLQIGRRLEISVAPPWLSGLSWPTWKSKTVILFLHQGTRHRRSKQLPAYWIHTCSRRALGIVVFWYSMDGDFTVIEIRFGARDMDLNYFLQSPLIFLSSLAESPQGVRLESSSVQT